MATEQSVRFSAHLEQGYLEIVTGTVDQLKEHMKAAGLPVGMLKKLEERRSHGYGECGSVAPSEPAEEPETAKPAEEAPAAEAQPEPEPEAPKEPEVDEKTLRAAVEALIQTSPAGAMASVQIIESFDYARNEQGQPKLSCVKPEDYAKAHAMATEKLAELSATKTAGVL